MACGGFNKKCDCSAATRTRSQTNFQAISLPALFAILALLYTHHIKDVTAREISNTPSKVNNGNSQNISIDYSEKELSNDQTSAINNQNISDDIIKQYTKDIMNVVDSDNNDRIKNHNDFPVVDISFISENISRLPISSFNGVEQKENPSSIPGRQLVDISTKALARTLLKGSVKNDRLQRNAQGSEKEIIAVDSDKAFKNESFTSKLLENYTTKNISNGYLKIDDIKHIPSLKLTPEINKTISDEVVTLPWVDLPLPLISDDCSEMKTDVTQNQRQLEDRDMENKNKQIMVNRKTVSLPSDVLLKQSKSISHIHSYDKERRHISEKRANAHEKSLTVDQNTTEKTKVSISNFDLKKEQYEELKTNDTHHGDRFDTTVLVKLVEENENFIQINKQITLQGNNSSTFDFFKRKTNAVNKNDDIEVDSVDVIEADDYDFNLTPEDDSVDGLEEDRVIAAVPRLNESKTPDKDEKWFAWHGRERDVDTLIRFSAGPPRERYIVPTLKLSDGTFIFRFLSGFFTFLHPFDFPAELLRDVMWNTLSVPQLILQSIRVEVGFIAAIVVAIICALAVPMYGLCRAVLAALGGRYEGGNDGAASPPPPGLGYEGGGGGGACEKRILLFFMQLLLLISVCAIATMVVGNESASNGVALTRGTLSAAARDLPTYLRSTHAQLSHVLLDSADQAFAAVNHDLDRVDILLGEPIQKELATETGIDVALDALSDITRVSIDLSIKTSSLGSSGTAAEGLANGARDRLRELRRQLDVARRHCSQRDRPLCETIDSSGVELILHFDMITEDKLEPLADVLSARNLSEATDIAKEQFAMVPQFVANQTGPIIEDIRLALAEKRADLRISERSLSKTARHLTAAAASASRHIEDVVRAIDAVEFWRWLIFLVAVLIVCLVIFLLLLSVFCGCCGAESQASSMLQSSVIMMCIFSIPLWALAVVVFVAGGHGEVFLCRPLYDGPDYKAVGKLFDRPGLLYKDGSGFFQELFKDLGNITIDVPMKDVLRECEVDHPAYPVFGLRRILDLDFHTAHFGWSRFSEAFRELEAHSPTPAAAKAAPLVHRALLEVVKRSSVNLTDYRMQLNGPLTGKDLNSLANQLESIANQISDLTTSSRIETLAARTRRLASSTIQPLDQLRTELVFKLTELELHMQPFQRQMNQSLSHLKTIQYYIDNQGSVIAEKKTREYVNRLTGYLEQYRGHVLDEVEKHVAPCGPIWDVYNAARTLVCRHYIDSLNGFWLGLCGCLFIWIGAAPLALKLRRACRSVRSKRSGLLLRTISHQNTSENAAISEQSAWSTPGEPRQPDNWR